MINFLRKHYLTLIGIPVGALGGYLYYHFWGCTESCTIRSSPLNMTLYGALMGALLFSMLGDWLRKK